MAEPAPRTVLRHLTRFLWVRVKVMLPHKLRYQAKGILRLSAARAKELIGAERRYCIRGAYKHRPEYSYFDDTQLTEEWQREVYQRAAKLMIDDNLKSVCDIGCGSG